MHRVSLAISFAAVLTLAGPLRAQLGPPTDHSVAIAPPVSSTPVATAHPADTTPTSAPPPAQVDGAPARPLEPVANGIPRTAAPNAHELSPWTMFLNADILVKIVMAGLALASVVTWTILVAKTIELGLARRSLARALSRTAGAVSLGEAGAALGKHQTVLDRLVAAVVDEMCISPGTSDGMKERAVSRCAEIVKAEGRTARRGMGALATIGAISPFVGLFGTVWGIMNSFIGISKAQTTNLAVVAPGIAEALLATAIGLAAAIPAVIIYNHFARATRCYGDLVQRASGSVMRLLSRDLDRRRDAGMSPLPQAAE
ncbi:tonB-system energizer ExbB [Methylobacterium sp. J-030]|uniref:tonB-system energizer ExbB n=1 Tax=Methylobacterium sp. J-030 TaxID=2836627 RepID=UPI001FB88EBB|nr:tonB-system energizer ExbB [Methylobacterium sp. J-030]MCJ2070852.1 tonB-system energizer ExbB [Methylobacterium sp. J-030]